MKISKNTICYASLRGHNNFIYPSNRKFVIKDSCEVERLSWTSGGDKVAIRIRKSNLIPITLCEVSSAHMSPPQEDGYIVVWIDKSPR